MTRTEAASPSRQASARETLAIPAFRRVFLASFASSVGRWMQNVTLGVLTWDLTHDPAFTTFVNFAQLFPLLALSIIGGGLADTLDRRKLLIVTQAWQAGWGILLAQQVMDDHISRHMLLLIVLMIGIGQAFFAPAFTAVVPSLVGPEHLSAAIALNSMQVNGSRVIGPAIGAYMASRFGNSEVFMVNSLSYVIIIITLMTVTIPRTTAGALSASARLLGGLRLARRSPQVGRPLGIMVCFSLFCLAFIGLMPVMADLNLGVEAKSQTYGNLYACFGLGALAGAGSVATILLRVPRELIVRVSLALFAVSLALLAVLRSPGPAYPTLFAVGLFYFTMPTALSTYLQMHLAEEVRGRVMALWIVSFGGVIAITNLFSGWLAERTSVTTVLLGGAVAAAVLALVVRLEPGPIVGDELTGTRSV